MKKIWIGTRESDILTYEFFDYSITFYGSNKGTNRAFCSLHRFVSNYSTEFTNFVVGQLDMLYEQHNCRMEIHFYNNVFAYKILEVRPQFKHLIKNINSLYIINSVRHKSLSRLWLSNAVPTPAFTTLCRDECSVMNLQKKFGNHDQFILQKNYSGGGTGTFIINLNNEEFVLSQLSKEELFLVSPFYEQCDSYSCHMFISESNYLILPASKQIINNSDNHMYYNGNDYSTITPQVSALIVDSTKRICSKLMQFGYRGICGADYIIKDNQAILIELNPRYMGSSFAINYALKKLSLPSLFDINNRCFDNQLEPNLLNQKLELDFKNYSLYYDKNNKNALKSVLKNNSAIVYQDGCLDAITFDEHTYLCHYLLFS